MKYTSKAYPNTRISGVYYRTSSLSNVLPIHASMLTNKTLDDSSAIRNALAYCLVCTPLAV